VASLRLVSPGAVTNGVTLKFFPQKSDDLFQFLVIIVHRHHSHPLRLQTNRLSDILCFSATKNLDFHYGVTPWMVSTRAVCLLPPLPIVMPLISLPLIKFYDFYSFSR